MPEGDGHQDARGGARKDIASIERVLPDGPYEAWNVRIICGGCNTDLGASPPGHLRALANFRDAAQTEALACLLCWRPP